MSVRDLVVRKGDAPLTFVVVDGLTLLIHERESGASTLLMTLAGRFSGKSGDVTVAGASKARERFRKVALAGVTLLDSLERQVSVREVLREQVAWSQPFFKLVPKDILGHPNVEPWLETLQLSDLDTSADIGDLAVQDRFRLRILLALVSRPDAAVLVVDDIDQLRSEALRTEVLEDLRVLSERIPVVAGTVNDDILHQADRVIDLRADSELDEPAEASEASEASALSGSTLVDIPAVTTDEKEERQ